MKKLDKTAQPNSFIILILFFAGLVIMSSLYVTIPLIPVLSKDFLVSESETVWISSMFTFCFVLFLDAYCLDYYQIVLAEKNHALGISCVNDCYYLSRVSKQFVLSYSFQRNTRLDCSYFLSCSDSLCDGIVPAK